ncbi:MAG TPA: VWA domain-containing protein [Pyrinomonadaceae bacterium]|nr:VWA domain-containing protein [Pyrinomonadaceae bacterium]
MSFKNLISAARFTGFLFRRNAPAQHSSAGQFSNIRSADFVSTVSRPIVALGLICLLFLSIPAQTPSEQDIDVLRTETDLTNLLFTATDKNNRYLTMLQQGDIRLLEDGVPQTIFTFQRETDRPLSIAFLVDVSGSEERTLPDEKAAARTFVDNVIRSSKDQAAIIPFEGYAHLEQPLTRDVLGIYRALEAIEVAFPSYMGSAPPMGGITSGPGTIAPPREGSTAIWDSIAVTCKEVLARSVGQRRRAIILLTDGFDTSSRLMRSEAVDRAILFETVIYAIGIGDKKQEGVDRNALKDLAERTGGRAFFPKKQDDLKAAFAEIEQELRSQYLVAYSSTNKKRDGSFRKMSIEITNPELSKQQVKLRYRPGYYAKRSQ